MSEWTSEIYLARPVFFINEHSGPRVDLTSEIDGQALIPNLYLEGWDSKSYLARAVFFINVRVDFQNLPGETGVLHQRA